MNWLDARLDEIAHRLGRWYDRLPWPLALVVAVLFAAIYVANTRF